MPAPLVLIDTSARVNRMHFLQDVYRSPRRRLQWHAGRAMFEPHTPPILHPETYIRLGHVYEDCLDTTTASQSLCFESLLCTHEHVLKSPVGILCLQHDDVDRVTVHTHGTSLHVSPGVMVVVRGQGVPVVVRVTAGVQGDAAALMLVSSGDAV